MLSTALPTAARAALLAGLLTAAAHAAGFPKPQGVVTDAASILPGASKAEAESLIHEAARKTTAEIAVATVSSLDGLSVEEYATRLFNEWGIGKKGVDNSVRRVAALAEARHVVTAEERQRLEAAATQGTAENRPPSYLVIPFLGMFIAAILFGSLFGGAPLVMALIPGSGRRGWKTGGSTSTSSGSSRSSSSRSSSRSSSFGGGRSGGGGASGRW